MTAKRVLPWLALLVVLVVALVVGTHGGSRPATVDGRVHHIADELRCPVCRSQSMADSDAQAAQDGRVEIRRRVLAGQSDAQIRAYFVGRYGEDMLLKPRGQGVAALVWALPVMVFAAALTALMFAFRRWRPTGAHATDDDRRIVREALE